MSAIAKQTGRFTETGIDEEIVLMRLDNGEFFSLTGTSAAIWRLIDGQRDRSALMGALTAEFGADEASIAAEVDDFLQELTELGLLARL